jgi:glycosyltransferase involved in cell wall biosynthesis
MALYAGRHGLLLRRIVFITQRVNPDHPALGATVAKIAALARRLDEVCVLAHDEVPGVLPENCRVRRFGAGSKPGRGVRFEAALARELGRPRPLAVVGHMAPIYAVLAAPLARPLGIRVLLWYTHWHASRTLRWAERVVNAVVSVDRRSFPIPSPKVHAIGHGIDLTEFACREAAPNGTVQALALGRYSPSKGLQNVVHAVRLALDDGVDLQLDVHGPTLSELEKDHRRTLGRLVDALDLTERVRLSDPVPRPEVPGLFAKSHVLVNNMRAGAPDKVVYEAAASCLPVLASNPVFDTLLEDRFRFDREEPAELADRLIHFAALDAAARRAVGAELRRRVEDEHSVDRWAEQLIAVAEKR